MTSSVVSVIARLDLENMRKRLNSFSARIVKFLESLKNLPESRWCGLTFPEGFELNVWLGIPFRWDVYQENLVSMWWFGFHLGIFHFHISANKRNPFKRFPKEKEK